MKTMGMVAVAALAANRWSGSSGRDDHGNLATNQIGRQLRHPTELILTPPVYDRHVLALDISRVFEALPKSAQKAPDSVRRSGIEESDHRHRRLLCARGQRPCDRSTAE
jgi:hypothetical protein